MDLLELVRCHNLGSTELRLAYNSRLFKVPAGGQMFIPAEAAVIHFGDWTQRGDRRMEEYRRIRGHHGCVPGESYEDTPGADRIPSDVLWEQRRPQVELYTVTDEKIVTVMDDPTGETLGAVGAPDDDKERILAALQAQLNRLEAELAAERSSAPTSPAPVDTPENAPRTKGRRPSEVKADAYVDSVV